MFGLMPRRKIRRNGGPLAMREPVAFEMLRREFAPLFDRDLTDWFGALDPAWFEAQPWRLDLDETDREFVIRADAPGFDPKEIEVRLSGGVLTMRAEHKEEPAADKKEPVERRYDMWERTVTLPAEIDPEKIEANYRNGVLEVRVPKAPQVEPKRIEVKT